MAEDERMDHCFHAYEESSALSKQGLDQLQQISKQLEQDMRRSEEERNTLLNMTHTKYEVDLPDIGDMVLMREEAELLTRHIAVMRARFAKFPPPEQLPKVIAYAVPEGSMNGNHIEEYTLVQEDPAMEPVPDYEEVKPIATSKPKQDTNVVETLQPLTKEEANQAVAMLESMKHGQKLTSEEGRELLQNLTTDEQSYNPSSKKPSMLRSKSKTDKLAILREDLAKNKGKSTRLTPEDLALIQYHLLNGKYKTRTLKQIRQGNTRNRASLFETF